MDSLASQCSSEELLLGGLGYAFSPRTQRRPKGPLSPTQDISKRYATYFPSKASFESKWNFADDGSTWEFSAAIVPSLSRSSSDSSSTSWSSSPAQQIALRYRTGIPPMLDSICKTASSSDSEYTKSSWETAPSPGNIDSVPSLIPSLDNESDIGALYRQSCTESLALARQEVVSILQQGFKCPKEGVACQRPGCRDTLRNTKALMYHLHIHNIHDRSTVCPSCQKRFRGGIRLRYHRCDEETPINEKRHLSPIQEGLRRVVKCLRRL